MLFNPLHICVRPVNTYDTFHGTGSLLRSNQLLSHTRISQNVMEPEGLLICSWSVSWTRSIHSISPTYFCKIHLNVISSLTLNLPSCLFPSAIPSKFQYAYLFFPMRATCFPRLILHLINGKFWRRSVSIFMLWFCPTLLWEDINICVYLQTNPLTSLRKR
jgi:hypothetical protein